MHNKRYIKIDTGYYPIDSMIWTIEDDGSVQGFQIGSPSEPVAVVTKGNAFDLVELLNELSLAHFVEEENG